MTQQFDANKPRDLIALGKVVEALAPFNRFDRARIVASALCLFGHRTEMIDKVIDSAVMESARPTAEEGL